MYDRDAQYGFDEMERKFNAALDVVRNQVDSVESNVNSLANTVNGINTLSFAEIVNILDNSYPEWSSDAYMTLGVSPSTVSDSNREAYNWCRQLASDTLLVKNTTNALKASGHSTFAANEGADLDIPRWDIQNGYIELGGVTNIYDLVYLLPNDLVVPGLVLNVQFEAMLRTSNAMPSGLQFFAALYDNTAGQRKIIEGGNFTIAGEIFGIPGSTTVEYQVVAQTDSGEQAISNILQFTNAPATFSQNNHPRISLRGAPGFIIFDIYRKIGSTYVYLYRVQNSIEGTYFDVGNNPIREVSAFPSLTATPPKAYAKTRTFEPGALSSGNFVRHQLTIQVPTTYDSSVTGAGMQWLRMGLTDNTDDARQIVIRKIGLSLGDGAWSRSPNDIREGVHSTRSTTATSSPTGGSGTGTGNPNPSGSGGCVLLDSMVDVLTDKWECITLRELSERCKTEKIYCDGRSAIAGKVLGVKIAYASRIYHFTLANELRVSCTHDHPFIVNRFNYTGTPASKLKKGDKILSCCDRVIEETEIVKIEEEFGDFEVGIPVLEGSHICILNGFASHNEKNEGGVLN